MDDHPRHFVDRFIDDIIQGPSGWRNHDYHKHVYSMDEDVAIAAWVIGKLADIQNPQSGLVMEAIRRERERRIGQASYKRVRKLATK